MVRLYDQIKSGNCYKVRLLLTLLGQPFERVHLDTFKGEARTPVYRAKNPNGKVPLLEWPDGRRLPESDAILWYLAEGTPYLPDDRWERAQVLQWMFFEQYSHEPYIAVVRFWHLAGLVEKNLALLQGKMDRGHQALEVMETHLATRPYFVAGRCTVADIALYAYTPVAPEGGFDLSRYPRVNDWLERVRARPGHVPITAEVGTLVRWP